MKIIKVEQGSSAWFQEKCGRFSASRFSTLMAGLSTKGYKDLITDITGEIISGEMEEGYINDDMQRGKDLEPEARREFIEVTGLNVHEVGFVLPDSDELAEWVGVSPDGLIFPEVAILEIKCPKHKTHLNYIRANRLPNEYKWQVQGQMLICGAEKGYFMSYYPGLKPFIIEVDADEKMQDDLNERFWIAIQDVKDLLEIYNKYDYN